LPDSRIRDRTPTCTRRAADKGCGANTDRRHDKSNEPKAVGRGGNRICCGTAIVQSSGEHSVRETNE
jgi:hypothetical protein